MKKYFILLTLVISALAWHEAHHSMMRSKLSNITIENIEALTNEEYINPYDRYGFKLAPVLEKVFNPYTQRYDERYVGQCCVLDHPGSICNSKLQTGECQ